MEKISAIITCFNREDEIERCLESVRWVDELMVVDSYSTDRTPGLARKYADRFLQHEYLECIVNIHRNSRIDCWSFC